MSSETRVIIGWYIVCLVILFCLLLFSGLYTNWREFLETILVAAILLAVIMLGCYLITGGR